MGQPILLGQGQQQDRLAAIQPDLVHCLVHPHGVGARQVGQHPAEGHGPGIIPHSTERLHIVIVHRRSRSFESEFFIIVSPVDS